MLLQETNIAMELRLQEIVAISFAILSSHKVRDDDKASYIRKLKQVSARLNQFTKQMEDKHVYCGADEITY